MSNETNGNPWDDGPADPPASIRTHGKNRRARVVDRLADAIDREERTRAKMRRAFKAWEKAAAAVSRLNRELEKETG